MTIHPIGHTDALIFALAFLEQAGAQIVADPALADYILLPVPSCDPDGNIKGGGSLPALSKTTVIIGGNLEHPAFAEYKCIDLLKDELYTAKNAMITAHCALPYAMQSLPVILDRCPVLLIGFGRISKCLARLLYSLGADITIAARKDTDRALAQALGYHAKEIAHIAPTDYRLIINTVPAMVLPTAGGCVKIDLASSPGIGGRDVIWAKGLPGKDAPESSGRLIADTVLRLTM